MVDGINSELSETMDAVTRQGLLSHTFKPNPMLSATAKTDMQRETMNQHMRNKLPHPSDVFNPFRSKIDEDNDEE